MEKTMFQRLTELNEKVAEKTPGFQVEANETGKFEWRIIAPDDIILYTRDSFDSIEYLALHLGEHARRYA